MAESSVIPCVLFPLRREALPFRRRLKPHRRIASAPCRAWVCGPTSGAVLVLETGIGRHPTEAALDWILSCPLLGETPYRPPVVVSAGFCGALVDGFEVGDAFVATSVANEKGKVWVTTWPSEKLIGEALPRLLHGRLLTLPRLLALPEQKRALGNRHAAAAVDMEGAILAERCSQAKVAFGCVRVVSDDARTPLSPRLASLLREGRVSAWRLLVVLVRSPSLLGELWRLAKQTRLAAWQLAMALNGLLHRESSQ
jgi:nucleoside phosphorylase